MFFLGDIACPEEKAKNFLDSVNEQSFLENEIVVYNLEGNIVTDEMKKSDGLHNDPQIVNAFSQAKKVIVSLANNHMYDYPEMIEHTVQLLEENEIGYFGLYSSKGEILPYEYVDESTGRKLAFFGHCWKLYTHTNRNTVNGIRVVDCDYDEFCSTVGKYVERHKETKVYCFMHWNYDMEILPFPMLRQVSRKLIDLGVEAVIGSHSHVPQGTEVYHGKLIAYCLGNFYIPSGYYFDGTLCYPKESKLSYIAGIHDDQSYEFRWFHTDLDGHKMAVSFDVMGEDADEKMRAISGSFELNIKEYTAEFRKMRKKRLLVPIFAKYGGVVHRLEECWAIARIRIIKILKE